MGDSDLEARFAVAIAMRDDGDWKGALRYLTELAAVAPDRATIWAAIGGIHFEREDWLSSAESFRRASQLSPSSEMCSASYFNSLVQLGKLAEASEEARRFLALHPNSEEYRLLKSELSEKGYSLLDL